MKMDKEIKLALAGVAAVVGFSTLPMDDANAQNSPIPVTACPDGGAPGATGNCVTGTPAPITPVQPGCGNSAGCPKPPVAPPPVITPPNPLNPTSPITNVNNTNNLVGGSNTNTLNANASNNGVTTTTTVNNTQAKIPTFTAGAFLGNAQTPTTLGCNSAFNALGAFAWSGQGKECRAENARQFNETLGFNKSLNKGERQDAFVTRQCVQGNVTVAQKADAVISADLFGADLTAGSAYNCAAAPAVVAKPDLIVVPNNQIVNPPAPINNNVGPGEKPVCAARMSAKLVTDAATGTQKWECKFN